MNTDTPGEEPLQSEAIPVEEPVPPPEPPEQQERVFVGTGLFWGLVIGLVLAVAIVILAAQNTQRTTVSFLGFEYSTPLIVVILIAFLVGIILDEIVGLVYRYRRRRVLAEREELKRLKGS